MNQSIELRFFVLHQNAGWRKFYHLPVMHHQHTIAVENCVCPVRNGEDGVVTELFTNRHLDQLVSLSIHTRCSFVNTQNLNVM